MLRLPLAATALAVFLSVSSAFADEVRMTRTISLTGHGEVQSVPDVATVTSGVTSEAATASEALAANTQAMNAVFTALKAAGIAEKDIQTSNFMVQPRYNYPENKAPELAGYVVTNNVTVTARKIGELGGLLDKLVQAGSNQINGIAFSVSEPDAALDEARKRAVEDAMRKAKVYAGAAGVTLGPVVTISESSGYQPPVPMVRAKAMMAESAPVPVAAGEQTLAVDVNITWEIK